MLENELIASIRSESPIESLNDKVIKPNTDNHKLF